MLGKLAILGRNRETYVINSYHTFIGSHSKCDIRVYGPGISPQHCVVTTLGDSSATIRNLPHNGTTLVNGCDIGMSDYTLNENDIIKIGNTKLSWSKADRKKASKDLTSGRLVAVVMPQKRSIEDSSAGASKRLRLQDNSNSSFSSDSGQWEKRTPQKKNLVHSTPAVRRHSRTESFRLLSNSNLFGSPSTSTFQANEISGIVDETLNDTGRKLTPKSSVKKVCFSSKRLSKKSAFDSPQVQKSILKKTDVLSTPTNVSRTKEFNFRSPRNSSVRTIMNTPNSTPMRPNHARRVALTEPRRVVAWTNLSSQIDALCLEKSLLAAKKLKSEPPKLLDKKKLAALLVCHKKKSPRKDVDEGPKTPQPKKRMNELSNLFIDMNFSGIDQKESIKKSKQSVKSNVSKSASSPSMVTAHTTLNNSKRYLGFSSNSPSIENLSLGISNEDINKTQKKLSKSKSFSRALSELNIDMNDSPKNSKSVNDENSPKKSRRSKSLENKSSMNLSPKKSPKNSDEKEVSKKLSKSMNRALSRLNIDMNDFPRKAAKSLVLPSKQSDHKENSTKKTRSKSLYNPSSPGKPTSIVSPSNELDKSKTVTKKFSILSRLSIDMNDSPKESKSAKSAAFSSPERVKKDLSASLNLLCSPKSPSKTVTSSEEKKHKPLMMRAENVNQSFVSENSNLPSFSPKVDIPQIPDLNLSLGIAKNVARILSSPLKDKATRMSAESPAASQESSPMTDVQEEDLLNALHLSRKSTLVEKPKQPVRRLRSFNKNNGIQQLFSSEYKHYSKEEVKKLFYDDTKPSTSVGGLKRKLYSPMDNSNIKSMDRVFTTSPVVDYTDISGVKRLFTISPKADYKDPRGIKELFAVNKNSYLNVSGVEDLFSEKPKTSGSNKRKSLLVKKTEKRVPSGKPQKEDASLKVRLEKKLSLKKSIELNKTVKEEPSSPKIRKTRKRVAETKVGTATDKPSVKVKKESLSLKESPSPPKRTTRSRAKAAKPASSPPKVVTPVPSSSKKELLTSESSSPHKKATTRSRGRPSIGAKLVVPVKSKKTPKKEAKTNKRAVKLSPKKEVKTRKRGAKEISSPENKVEPKKKATKQASSPAKEVKSRKRVAKESSSPVKKVEPKKKATKEASSQAKEVKSRKRGAKESSSPEKEVKTKKRATKQATSPAKEVKTRKRGAKDSPAKKVEPKKKAIKESTSPAKEVRTRKRGAKESSSPAKKVEPKKKTTKEALSSAKEAKKRGAKQSSSPKTELKTKKKEKASSPVKEVKTRKKVAKQVSPVKETETKKKGKKQSSSPVASKTKKPSSSKSRKDAEPSTSRKPKSPPAKASPKKRSAKKPRLIVKITSPKLLGSILKKTKGKKAASAAKKVLFDKEESLSPSPPKRKTQKKK